MLLKLALYLHIVSAMFWVGGMLFLVLVIAPFLKTLTDPREKSRIFQVVGKQYRFWGWVAIITLLVTGPIALYLNYGLSVPDVFKQGIHTTPLGRTISVKLALVALIVISSLVHDFYVGPKAKTSPKIAGYARIFGRGNMILALIIVLFAVFIRLGGI